MENGCVVVDDATITYAGPARDAPGARATDSYQIPVVMPGMWDCHGHFLGVTRLDLAEVMRTPIAVSAARIVGDAYAALMAGFTSVREPGGLGVYLARVINEGLAPGPHIYGAGAILSQTAGHGDLHEYPLKWMHDLAEQEGFIHLADGIDGCLVATRTQLRLGAAFIKVCASGGVLSQLDNPIHQQFRDDELAAIVGEAERFERIVAAHCHGKPGIMAALRAGCKTIEHGSYLDEESADEMIKKNAVLVPTRYIVERLVEFGRDHGLPDYAFQKITALADQHREALKLAVAKGVTIALGTDIATSGENSGAPWGMNGRELRNLVDAGMEPLAAIEAATANGPLTLGPQAPRTGKLDEGHVADVIALAEDPLNNIDVLAEPKNVTHVWKDGRLVKEPAA
ncbi:MAG: amidohydrolase family protein [Actinomycetota bacterium]|nr:amidohydrolase family protein [Actinomycetota bacterium]